MERLQHAVEYAAKASRSRRAKERNKRQPGYIYMVQCHEYVKVGFAAHVSGRIAQLQTGCPYELKLLKSWFTRHMEYDEERLHLLWKRYEIRGEWFNLPAGELAFALSANDLKDLHP